MAPRANCGDQTQTYMKMTKTISALVAMCFLAGVGVQTAEAKEKSKSKSKPKITKSEAKKIALAKVPNGKVKETELETEHGKLIWSLDIATRGSKDVTEVHVDALTGDVVAIEHETPGKQSKKSKKSKKSGKSKKSSKAKKPADPTKE